MLLRNNKGSLSVTALWMLALLTLLATGVMRTALMGLRLDGYALRATEASWLARAGIWHAIALLKHDAVSDSLNYDALIDPWANSPELLRHVNCGNGFFEVSYALQAQNGNRNDGYGMRDENRKININLASADVLLRLPGMNPEKVAALLDWRDKDDLTRDNGAENAYYRRLLNPYSCKNAALDMMQEILFVKGFSAEDVQVLSPLTTLYGDGAVNINTTSAEVLAILGLSKASARQIIKVRLGTDKLPFTKDDNIFKNPGDIVDTLMPLVKLKPTEQALLRRLVDERLLGVHSTDFTIQSVGVTQGGKVRKKISAVVHRTHAREIKIVAWNEHAGP
ncbi:MAG: general secretion pathway protein GspK [bacterium]